MKKLPHEGGISNPNRGAGELKSNNNPDSFAQLCVCFDVNRKEKTMNPVLALVASKQTSSALTSTATGE